jgi:UPF0042 nucleotide-binding protein
VVRALRRRREEPAELPDFTIITGLSGAGRTTVADVIEDLGYFVIDNLPPTLIGKVAELVATPGKKVPHVALVVDVRGGQFFPDLSESLKELTRRGFDYRILFLTASDDVLVRRYEATRRRHPMADRIIDGIAKERSMLESMRSQADLVIDTSELTPHELREKVASVFAHQTREARLQVNMVSFGYKFGLPLDADLVLDVRFLPNPYWVEELRPIPGTDERVHAFVMGRQATVDFLQKWEELLEVLVPGYLAEGKRYLTIAVGCSGGRHRSPVIAGEIADMLRRRGLPVFVEHRDIDRE